MAKSFLSQLFSSSSDKSNSYITKRELDNTNGYLVENKITDYNYLENLSFDKKNNLLTFEYINFTSRPKITRYKTINYVRFPIYEDYAEKTKIIKKFSKQIIPERFVSKDINSESFSVLSIKDKEKIIEKIGIIPQWLIDYREIIKLRKDTKNLREEIRSYEKEKTTFYPIPIVLKEKPNKFWWFLFFGFLTLFIPFLFYRSKKKAKRNIEENNRIKIKNQKDEESIILKNQQLLIQINNENTKITKEIEKKQEKIQSLTNKDIKFYTPDQQGWIDIRKAMLYDFPEIKNTKGVYIIWNKTKDTFYVGQSKNVNTRMKQHFSSKDVKNVIFAKDWYNGDEFVYTVHYVNTKDELDALEKEKINEYNSFENGYNKTGGNT